MECNKKITEVLKSRNIPEKSKKEF